MKLLKSLKISMTLAIAFSIGLCVAMLCGCKKEPDLAYYKINYHLDGGTNDSQNLLQVISTDMHEISFMPASKDHHVFDGWFLDENFQTPYTPQRITSDISLYAKFLKIYYVGYEIGGGDNALENVKEVVETDETIYEMLPARKVGHTFEGWFLDGEYKEAYIPQRITADIELYAKFVPIPYNVTIIDKYAEGGKTEFVVPYGTNINLATYEIGDPNTIYNWSVNGRSVNGLIYSVVGDTQIVASYSQKYRFENGKIYGFGPSYSTTTIVIPDTIDGEPVTMIMPNAFKNQQIKSIQIGNYVENIGDAAFAGNGDIDCLKNELNLTIPDSVVYIGENAFSLRSITSLSIGSGIEHIGFHAFFNVHYYPFKIGNKTKNKLQWKGVTISYNQIETSFVITTNKAMVIDKNAFSIECTVEII